MNAGTYHDSPTVECGTGLLPLQGGQGRRNRWDVVLEGIEMSWALIMDPEPGAGWSDLERPWCTRQCGF